MGPAFGQRAVPFGLMAKFISPAWVLHASANTRMKSPANSDFEALPLTAGKHTPLDCRFASPSPHNQGDARRVDSLIRSRDSVNPNPDPAKHQEIPIWNAENWFYEDFEVGHKIRSIRRTISEGESMLFNALVLDMHPYVGDEIFARKEGVFGRRLVAGAMVF